MREWKSWDWAAYCSLVVVAIVEAAEATLHNAPTIAKNMPEFLKSEFWAFVPLALVMFATMILVARAFGWIGTNPKKRVWEFQQILQRTYENETIQLDGREFVDCVFDNITFRYQGTAPFKFTNVRFVKDTKFYVASSNPIIKPLISFYGTVGPLAKFGGATWNPDE